MTEQELVEQRRAKWRVNGNPIRTLEEAREFLEEVGFCLTYPVLPPKLAPTFFGATVGSDLGLALQQQAFSDPRSRSEEHTSELQSQSNLVCRLLLEKKKKKLHGVPTRS